MTLTKRERKELLKERLKGVTHADIAKDAGYARSTVTLVINGRTQLLSKDAIQKIRLAVANRAGVRVDELWAA